MNPLLYVAFVLTNLSSITYRTLTWDDFKGKPYTEDNAMTVSRIDVMTFETDGKVEWEIDVVFDADSSFTRTFDAHTLEHERGHLALTEYYGGKIRKFLIPYQNCSVLKSKSVEIVIDRIISDWGKMERKYDAETRHSINQYEQKKWNEKIKQLLKS